MDNLKFKFTGRPKPRPLRVIREGRRIREGGQPDPRPTIEPEYVGEHINRPIVWELLRNWFIDNKRHVKATAKLIGFLLCLTVIPYFLGMFTDQELNILHETDREHTMIKLGFYWLTGILWICVGSLGWLILGGLYRDFYRNS